MSLFNRVSDRKQTQLAYRVKYFPWSQLSPIARGLVVWKKHTYMTKLAIMSSCDETLETMAVGGRHYKILWVHNNVPTEREWNKKPDSFLVRTEFRCSPAIPEGAVVILSFWSEPCPEEHGAPL